MTSRLSYENEIYDTRKPTIVLSYRVRQGSEREGLRAVAEALVLAEPWMQASAVLVSYNGFEEVIVVDDAEVGERLLGLAVRRVPALTSTLIMESLDERLGQGFEFEDLSVVAARISVGPAVYGPKLMMFDTHANAIAIPVEEDRGAIWVERVAPISSDWPVHWTADVDTHSGSVFIVLRTVWSQYGHTSGSEAQKLGDYVDALVDRSWVVDTSALVDSEVMEYSIRLTSEELLEKRRTLADFYDTELPPDVETSLPPSVRERRDLIRDPSLSKLELVSAALAAFRSGSNDRYVWPETGDVLQVFHYSDLGQIVIYAGARAVFRANTSRGSMTNLPDGR